MSTTTIILIGIAVLVLVIIFLFNRFVQLRNRAEEAWSDISVQLKRRYDIVPNLVETVKGYAAHESSAFENVTKARAAAMGASASAPGAQAQAENMLSGALKTLFAVSEAYPDLKANQNFLHLQKELADTEDKIQASRRFYNTNVLALNIALESFPSNIVGSTFGFTHKDLFELSEADAAAKDPVNVQF